MGSSSNSGQKDFSEKLEETRDYLDEHNGARWCVVVLVVILFVWGFWALTKWIMKFFQ